MCVGMQSSPMSYPNVGPRDTSNEIIKSDYELSEENKRKNASILAARNRAQSLVTREKKDPRYDTAKIARRLFRLSKAERQTKAMSPYEAGI